MFKLVLLASLAIDDLHDLTDTAWYDRLLQEFPEWLRAARAEGRMR